MNLVLGEILFDIFPAYRRLGGAPFNVAFHLKHLGMPVRFISRVGSDPEGDEIRGFLAQNGFRLEDVQVDSEHPTGTVRVALDENGVPQFEIVADVAYDHLEPTPHVVSCLQQGVDLIYFGTLIQRSESGYRTLQDLLNRKSPHTRCFYDVNLRPKSYSLRAVRESLRQADHVKLNQQELEVLQDMFALAGTAPEVARALMTANNLQSLTLTRGEAGSELYTAAGIFTAPPSRPVKVADTVGAGDAYAAVSIVGLLQGWQPQKIVQAAAAFAARICEIEGAIPTNKSFYTDTTDPKERI